MKKNMMSILILALLIVNIVLTAIMMFSVVGTAKKTSALIDDIASVLKLELDNQGVTGETTVAAVPIDDVATYNIAEELTIPLAQGADGKPHYFLVAVTLSMNTKDKGYKKYSEGLAEKEQLIKGEIVSVISNYTLEEVQENTDAIRMEILGKIQSMYDSKFIYNVTFTKALPQ